MTTRASNNAGNKHKLSDIIYVQTYLHPLYVLMCGILVASQYRMRIRVNIKYSLKLKVCLGIKWSKDRERKWAVLNSSGSRQLFKVQELLSINDLFLLKSIGVSLKRKIEHIG